jgi:hypothetical protein
LTTPPAEVVGVIVVVPVTVTAPPPPPDVAVAEPVVEVTVELP